MATLRDLLRVVHQWAADELPGLVPSYVVIRFQNCDTKMQFPVPPAVLLSGPAAATSNGTSPAVEDVRGQACLLAGETFLPRCARRAGH